MTGYVPGDKRASGFMAKGDDGLQGGMVMKWAILLKNFWISWRTTWPVMDGVMHFQTNSRCPRMGM